MRRRKSKRLKSIGTAAAMVCLGFVILGTLYLLTEISAQTKPQAMAESIEISTAPASDTLATVATSEKHQFDLLETIKQVPTESINLDSNKFADILGDESSLQADQNVIDSANLLGLNTITAQIPGR